MADKDISRLMVEKSLASLQRMRALFRMRMPYGPTTVRLTPGEAKRMHEGMSDEDRLELSRSMGIDDYLKMMTEVYYGRSSKTDREPF